MLVEDVDTVSMIADTKLIMRNENVTPIGAGIPRACIDLYGSGICPLLPGNADSGYIIGCGDDGAEVGLNNSGPGATIFRNRRIIYLQDFIFSNA